VHAGPENGGGEGVRSRDVDFDCVYVDDPTSSEDTKSCGCVCISFMGEAMRFRYPFSFVRERGKNIYLKVLVPR
jgi:hypothetical protein